ncbi:hypothetical protein [Chitinibacter sp. S2-10]|uniref:hypothetical protein n=1 Tax=Chitinibacter sp. S2-10 TaxID=3373597 RepID=UPI00397785E2
MRLDQSALFFRTDRGSHELRERSPGFPNRQRQLLFLIDGKKCLTDLMAFNPDLDDLTLHLTQLHQQGLIACRQNGQSIRIPPAAVRATSRRRPSEQALLTAYSIIAESDASHLNNQLASMINTTFSAVQCSSDLQYCIDRWQKALRELGLDREASEALWQVRSALSD